MVNERIIQFVCLFIAVLIATLYLNSLKNKPKEIEIKGIENIVIYLNNEKNNLILVNNDTVKELINILPIESQITKEEMYLSLELDRELSSNDKVTKVEKGDVVLFKNKTSSPGNKYIPVSSLSSDSQHAPLQSFPQSTVSGVVSSKNLYMLL